MDLLDKQNLKSILKPLKNKIDNLNKFKDEATIQLNNKLSLTGGTLTGSLSIKNGDTTNIVLSAQENSARLSIGSHHLDFTKNGELKINGANINTSSADIKLGNIAVTTTTTEEKYIQNRNIPYEFYNGLAVAIGNNVYLLGGINIDYRKYNYKYDTTTDTYTQNSSIPYVFEYGSAVAIGTDIYLLGGSNNNIKYMKNNYKYDTITNTYTKNKDTPYDFFYGSAVSIGNNIYLLGGNNTVINYKYNTITDTYTKNKDIPYSFSDGSAVAIGNNIYLLGNGYYGNADYMKYNYKYNTTTDTYTKNKDIPYVFGNGSAVAIGNDIYLLGGLYNSGSIEYFKYNYKYNITTDTYTKNKDIPYVFADGSAVAIGTDIYLLGSGYYDTTNRIHPYAKYNYIYDTITTTTTATTTNYIIKPSNHSIYTQSKSYTSTSVSIVEIGDEYYTEYKGNNIVKNTFNIDTNGTTKMYIKSGAILNGKKVPCKTEGWQTINILKYI